MWRCRIPFSVPPNFMRKACNVLTLFVSLSRFFQRRHCMNMCTQGSNLRQWKEDHSLKLYRKLTDCWTFKSSEMLRRVEVILRGLLDPWIWRLPSFRNAGNYSLLRQCVTTRKAWILHSKIWTIKFRFDRGVYVVRNSLSEGSMPTWCLWCCQMWKRLLAHTRISVTSRLIVRKGSAS